MDECRQAVILAAGRGSRLAPWTDDRPKCLVELDSSPLLDSLLSRLCEVGVVDVVLVAGYHSAEVRAHVARRHDICVQVVENPNWAGCRIALAPLGPEVIGTRARAEAGRVVALGSEGDYKTVNAASFSPVWWRDWFRPALEQLIAAGRTGEFYEAAVADALRAGAPPLAEVVASAGEWFEIDTAADLAEAERCFALVRAA